MVMGMPKIPSKSSDSTIKRSRRAKKNRKRIVRKNSNKKTRKKFSHDPDEDPGQEIPQHKPSHKKKWRCKRCNARNSTKQAFCSECAYPAPQNK